MLRKALVSSVALFGLAATPAFALVTQFNLLGKAGAGLLGGNENQAVAVVGGSGGEVGAGISFDDANNLLTINVAWGSGNSFVDLTGAAAAGHIHGVTAGIAPASFDQNAPVLIGLNALPGFNGSATDGGFSGSVTLAAENVANLFAGQLYLNFHTATYPGGEIRGNMVPIPEPATYALMLGGLVAVAAYVRRRNRDANPA
ncbi:MAG: CHRD domain-containing protein [Burkholderiaceae bacterium]